MFYAFLTANTNPWQRLVEWYDGSALKEILLYLEDTYFTVHLHAYENLSLDSNAAASARTIIFALGIGMVLASVLAAYTRNELGSFARKLHAEDCHSPEKAKTLMELGFFQNASVRRELSHGFTLRKVVRCCEEEEHVRLEEQKRLECEEANKQDATIAPYKSTAFCMDFSTAHFYIPEELRHRADIRFDQKGSSWRLVIGTALVALIITALLCRYLPDILQLADNIISLMSPGY